ncbi:MAG: bifunctional phosphoribosylaminoimidazolecarboxamide formyltransferase/IMP cyclohydrolase [Bryobacteraceae bacterium]|nr:bifunctional phosphoribosylaminoimidazolecarboxamide formyltransferase/IMP cyclohydrolase [Bryobacteraceae bacterium]
MAKITRALISVTDKTGIAEFATGLSSLGVEIVSTGGTYRTLQAAGIAPLREVAELTGFPEMLDGRVKTIHPRIAAGILALRGNREHMEAMSRHDLPLIDMVVVNLYPFERFAADPHAKVEELVENIDIGGPTMIRAAAKNWQDVAVVTGAADYDRLLAELRDGAGWLSPTTHWLLMQKAFWRTAEYDRAISARLSRIWLEEGGWRDERTTLPPILDVRARQRFGLRYGENPHQHAALYSEGGEGIAGAEQLHGKELSYNNLVDLDAAWQLIQEFTEPACAIIKHTNPCGCAEGATVADAYRRAYEADTVSAFGGVLAFNRRLDAEAAGEIAKLFVEAIAAPDYSAEALEILGAKKNLRLLRVHPSTDPLVIKSISGGYLVQTADGNRLDRAECAVKTQRPPSEEEWSALLFGWRVCKHVKSNAIVYARPGQSISVGAGQMSRVDSVKVGAMKAILPLEGSVLASDAFFPFPDGLEEAAKHGITAVIQPGGSVRDPEVIAAADRLGLAMVFTGVRHFRH